MLAQSLINALPVNTLAEQNYQTVMNLSLQTHSGSLSSDDLNDLEIIANGVTPAAAYAKGILSRLMGNLYDPVLPVPSNAKKSDTKSLPQPVWTKAELGQIKVLPNPVRQMAQIYLPPVLSTEPAQISIYDLNGRLVEQVGSTNRQHIVTIDTEGLQNGIYLVLAEGANFSSQTKMLVQN